MAFNITSLSAGSYHHGRHYLNIRIAVGLVFFAIAAGVTGFMFFENYTLSEAVYMTIITISTVGYTEIHPLSANGRIFTSLLIILNIGVFTYGVSVFTYFIIQGNFLHSLHLVWLNKKIKKLKDHVIVCGYGRYGTEVCRYFLKHKVPVLVIENDPEQIRLIQQMDAEIPYIEDDATGDDVLIGAGVEYARAIICALPDDTDNLFAVLSARQLNPNIDIISRARKHRSIKKLQLAGASHVIMPEQIGGFFMATIVNKPNATEFFSFISDELEHDIGFEQLDFEDLPQELKGKSIREMKIRDICGANIIGYRKDDGEYVVNPEPDTVLQPDSSFIVLGNSEQIEKLRTKMKVKLDEE